MPKDTNPITTMAERIELWPVERLQPYAKNARTHSDEQVDQIAASIREFGFTNPILVDSADGIIAGHGRLMASKRLGLTTVPVIVLDHLTDAQRRAYILADNKLAMNAGWDNELLAQELQQLDEEGFDLELVGFSDEELEDLLGDNDIVEQVPEGDPDQVPEPQPDPVSVTGDVWILGKHRVMCGDSTSIDAVDKLMNGQSADILLTDPPYGIGADTHQGKQENGWKQYGNSGWDVEKPDSGWWSIGQQLTRHQIVWGGNYFTDVLPPSQGWLVWDKGQRDFSLADGELAWTSFDRALRIKTISRAAALKDGKVHPTQKSVELIQWCIERADDHGKSRFAAVLDLFGGSGTTLIACEGMSRKAFLMELSQHYCDVIVRRWQDFTGKRATLEGDGRTFDELSAERLPAAA